MTEAEAPISRTINKRTPPFTTPIATFPHDKTTHQKLKFPAENVYTLSSTAARRGDGLFCVNPKTC